MTKEVCCDKNPCQQGNRGRFQGSFSLSLSLMIIESLDPLVISFLTMINRDQTKIEVIGILLDC